MVQAEWVTLEVQNEPMRAYVATPDEPGTYPGVIVFMEIFGINEHIQEVTRRLAAEGYVAIAPNFYHRQAPDLNLGYTAEAIEIGRQYKAQVSHADLIADAQASIAYLQSIPVCFPKDKLGSVGFCFGGYVGYVVATLPEIMVTASFYGAGIAHKSPEKEEAPIDLTDKINGFMFCGFGEKDSSILPEDIEAIKQALQKANIAHQIIVYPDAEHGFLCDKRPSYNASAAAKAWQDLKQLLGKHL